MATIAGLSPVANSCATPHTSCDQISSSVTPQVSLKSVKKFSGRFGHGSCDAFSSGRVRCTRILMRTNSGGARVEHYSDIEPQSTVDESASDLLCTGFADWFSSSRQLRLDSSSRHGRARTMKSIFRCNCTSHESQETADKEDSVEDAVEPSGGVAIAVKLLQFYKREISPLLPGSCRFVPTCSEYGMQAFKKYGVAKGAILTAWRLSRCNPLGGSGFDPPRWFDEPRPPQY